MRRRKALRTIRLTAPSLVVLAGLAALVVVLLNDGSSTSACAHGQSAAHCRHAGTRVAGDPAQSDGTSGGHGPAYSAGSGHAAGSTGASGVAGAASGTSSAGAGGTTHAKGGGGGASLGAPGARPEPADSGTTRYGQTTAGRGDITATGVRGANGTLAGTHSESGTWSTESPLETELEPWVTAATITLPTPLSHPLYKPEVTYIPLAEASKAGTQRSAATKAACGESGTVRVPTAKPGHLCVYAGAEDFSDRNHAGRRMPFVDAEFFAIIKSDGETGADTKGFRIAFGVPNIRTAAEKASDAYPHIVASGSWALTGA
jgi:hypothetical protein